MNWIDKKMLEDFEGNKSKSDIWFAWYPVRLGALGTGRLIWFKKVWRNKCCGITIYQLIHQETYMDWPSAFTAVGIAASIAWVFVTAIKSQFNLFLR